MDRKLNPITESLQAQFSPEEFNLLQEWERTASKHYASIFVVDKDYIETFLTSLSLKPGEYKIISKVTALGGVTFGSEAILGWDQELWKRWGMRDLRYAFDLDASLTHSKPILRKMTSEEHVKMHLRMIEGAVLACSLPIEELLALACEWEQAAIEHDTYHWYSRLIRMAEFSGHSELAEALYFASSVDSSQEGSPSSPLEGGGSRICPLGGGGRIHCLHPILHLEAKRQRVFAERLLAAYKLEWLFKRLDDARVVTILKQAPTFNPHQALIALLRIQGSIYNDSEYFKELMEVKASPELALLALPEQDPLRILLAKLDAVLKQKPKPNLITAYRSVFPTE